MKLLSILLLSFVSILGYGATFTFHAVKDNWTEISVNLEPLLCNPILGWQSYVIGYWDWGWDQAFPAEAYSGLDGEEIDCDGNYTQWLFPAGYSDTLSFTVTNPVHEVLVWLSGPYPNYQNCQMNFDLQRQPEGGIDLVDGGEVWVDFGADGLGRIELIKPTDFGKWACDGSINPNWVEPIALKPGRRLGHHK